MLDVVWVLIAVAFLGPNFDNVSIRQGDILYATRHECMKKRAELLELAAPYFPASVECIPVENPAAKK